MFFKNPAIPTEIDGIYYLAPVPLLMEQFEDHDYHDAIYDYGFDILTDWQKRMGQELPGRYDTERHESYEVNYWREDKWVEDNEEIPIGSRFYTPPNDFLEEDHEDVRSLKTRIHLGFHKLIESLGGQVENVKITESWMQFYNPYDGRGHNQHNHCRWTRDESIRKYMFSGGYYLSDGDPIKDHPYSGVFTFHLRGQQYMIRPKKGMLMIWPYDIVHSVKPFYGKSHRCVINFNIQGDMP